MFYKIGALKNFAQLTGKYLCQIIFFNKVEGSPLENSCEFCETVADAASVNDWKQSAFMKKINLCKVGREQIKRLFSLLVKISFVRFFAYSLLNLEET